MSDVRGTGRGVGAVLWGLVCVVVFWGGMVMGQEGGAVMHPEDMELMIEEPAEGMPGGVVVGAETQPGTKGDKEPGTQPAGVVGPVAAPKPVVGAGAGAVVQTQPGGRESGRGGATTQASTQAGGQTATQPTTQPNTRPATQPSTQPTTRPGGSAVVLQPLAPVRPAWDHFQVIYQRNMFMQQRSGSDRGLFTSDGQVPRPQPTEYKPVAAARPLWILTGVAVLDDDKMAFAENITTGQTSRARVGDKLGEMKVTAIAAEGVELELEGKSLKVNVGSSLDGRSVDGVLQSGAAQVVQPTEGQGAGGSGGGTSSGGASAGGTGGPSAAGTSDESAIRERLKRRRMEEGGK